MSPRINLKNINNHLKNHALKWKVSGGQWSCNKISMNIFLTISWPRSSTGAYNQIVRMAFRWWLFTNARKALERKQKNKHDIRSKKIGILLEIFFLRKTKCIRCIVLWIFLIQLNILNTPSRYLRSFHFVL